MRENFFVLRNKFNIILASKESTLMVKILRKWTIIYQVKLLFICIYFLLGPSINMPFIIKKDEELEANVRCK